MLYILSYTFSNASFNCKVLTNFLYLNKLFLVLFIMGLTSKKGATRLSFALAHDVRRLSATLTDILTSVGGSSPNTLSRVFATDCLQSTNKKATFSGDFFLFVVGATRFEHATSWSQTKRSTRLSYAPSTDLVITTYFSILQALF